MCRSERPACMYKLAVWKLGASSPDVPPGEIQSKLRVKFSARLYVTESSVDSEMYQFKVVAR